VTRSALRLFLGLRPGRRLSHRLSYKKVCDQITDLLDLSRHVKIDLAGPRLVADFLVESRF